MRGRVHFYPLASQRSRKNGAVSAVRGANPMTPEYPLLESMLRIKGLALQATYTNSDVASLFDTSIRTIQNRVADGTLHSAS
jgi:hypothetical protein